MKTKILLPFAILVVCAIPAVAVNHPIQITGFTYSPDSLNVEVGDTVTWQGNFSLHPLAHITIPPGANPINNSSGSTYSYVVQVAGEYTYRCTNHGSPNGTGMTGKFIAADVTTTNPKITAEEIRIFPSITTDFVNVALPSPLESEISIDVFNTGGKLVCATKFSSLTASKVDLTDLEAGIYFLFVRSKQGILAEKKVVKQ